MSTRPTSFARLTEAALCAAAFAALLAPRAAHAQTTAPAKNHAYSCIPDGKAGESNVTISKDANKVTGKVAGAIVHCPITIKTSGPGVHGSDGIKSVALTTTGSVSCTILTRRGPIASGSADLNDIGSGYQGSRSSATSGLLTINTVQATRPVDYWHANQYTGSGEPSWFYSYLTCTLGAGATISGDYTTTEYGTDAGYTIDPFFTCGLSSDMPWTFDEVFHAPSSAYMDGTGGFVRAQAGSHQFTLTCPSMPANSSIELMMSAPGATNIVGCNLNNSNLSSVTWWLSPTSGQFPESPWSPSPGSP